MKRNRGRKSRDTAPLSNDQAVAWARISKKRLRVLYRKNYIYKSTVREYFAKIWEGDAIILDKISYILWRHFSQIWIYLLHLCMLLYFLELCMGIINFKYLFSFLSFSNYLFNFFPFEYVHIPSLFCKLQKQMSRFLWSPQTWSIFFSIFCLHRESKTLF